MPNETIVQYILNVDTDRAEKGLKDTSQASRQVEQSFDKVGQATTQMNAKLKSTEQQAKLNEKSFRRMRKAGRDLDGALGDIAQGANLVNPALGNMFMTMSDGASVADGFSRIMITGLNPAILSVGLAASAAALAFTIYQQDQEAAAQQAEATERSLDNLTTAIQNQRRVLGETGIAVGSYITDLNNAQAELSVLKGIMSEVDLERMRASESTAKAFAEASAAIDKQQEAEEALLRERENQVKIIEAQIRAGNENKKIILQNARDSVEAQKNVIQELDKERGKLRRRRRELDDTLQSIISINEEKEKEREIDRKNAKNRAQSERERRQQQAAAQKLQEIINKLTLGELTGREKIEEQYRQELAQINEIAEKSGDIENAEKARLLLLQKKDRLLDEELRKEQEKLSIIKEQGKEAISIISSTVQALRSPEAFVSSLGGIVGEVGGVFGSAGTAAAGAAISTAAPAVTAIAGFGSLIQKAIDESDVSLDENQARRVVLGNMNEAFQNFNRDFERGLELLPETIVRVLPEFIVSLGKVLTVDLARVIAIDLPLALIRTTPELIIAIINEVAFLLADLVNGFKFALDQFTSFIQSVFTREGRRDAVASSIDGLKRFFETRFDGVGALRESVSAFAGGGSFIPQAAGGMRFTGNQRSGLAMLHQGEFVVPQSGMRPQSVDRQMNRSGGSPINIVINSPVVEQNAVDALVRRIEERFNSNFGLASSNLFGGR